MLNWIGNFHPLLLHLPIGIFVYAFLQCVYDIWRKKELSPAIDFALKLGIATAIFSSLTGWFLAHNGEYEESNLLWWHQWLGVGTAVTSVLLFLAYKGLSPKIFTFFFALFMGLLSITGHYGGSLTHGEDFLKFKPKEKTGISEDALMEAHVFHDLIMPIVDSKCVSCHNPNKTKGGLLMHDLKGFQKGGKTGGLVIAGDPSQSLMSQRMHLPMEEEEHMPPKGKKQLSTEEVKLIDWWIENMMDYEHQLSDLAPGQAIMKVIKTLYLKESYNAEPVNALVVDQLQNYGIDVRFTDNDSPWLFAKTKEVGDLNKLSEVKDQLRYLDLSGSNIQDNDVKKLRKFKNLKELNLSLTGLSSGGIKKLKGLSSLEYLNLYRTSVDKSIFNRLEKLSGLKNVYLWQTDISQEDVTSWEKKPKDLSVELGVDLSLFASSRLEPPIIEADKDIFRDSLLISLDTRVPDAKVYFTLDGTEPDSTSALYSKPFTVEESVEVKTYVSREGWANSEIATRSFARAKYTPQKCLVDVPPHERYKGEGAKTLVDFEKGTESFTDGRWLGWEGTHAAPLLDLGNVQEIQKVTISTLQDFANYIFYPESFSVELSKDGKSYRPAGERIIPRLEEPAVKSLDNFTLNIGQQQARYVRVKIKSRLKNPEWHAAPGADCWIFVDEIVVE